MPKPEKKIRVKLVGRDAHTAYVYLPGYRDEPAIVTKTFRIDDLIEGYKGPQVHFDFNRDGLLIGIEILVDL